MQQRQHERNPEQEKIERRRLVSYSFIAVNHGNKEFMTENCGKFSYITKDILLCTESKYRF